MFFGYETAEGTLASWSLIGGVVLGPAAVAYLNFVLAKQARREAREDAREVKEAAKQASDRAEASARDAAQQAKLVKKDLAVSTSSTKEQLDQQSDSLNQIHIAVNSTLTAAVEGEIEAKRVSFILAERLYKLLGTEDDKAVMEAARASWEKAASAMRAKANSQKSGLTP